MDAKEVLKKMNENYFSVAAIRRCRKDENYEVGDICRNSFDWNYEKDESTFEDDEPVELSGTCGMRIENLENLEFSSPIGESTFSTKFYKGIVKETYRFRPLSGNLLSLHLLKEEFGIEL